MGYHDYCTDIIYKEVSYAHYNQKLLIDPNDYSFCVFIKKFQEPG